MRDATSFLIVVLDGLRPDLLNAELTPNLSAFIEASCTFTESRCVFPSATRVNAATLGTGTQPSRHGIVANKFFDPCVFPDRLLHSGERESIQRAEQAYAGSFVTAPALGDLLAKAGKSLAVVSSGSAGTTHLVNPRARQNRQISLTLRDWAASTPDDVAAEMQRLFGPPAAAGFPNSARMRQQTTIFLEGIFPRYRPDVSLLWYNDPDHTFHHCGLGSEAAEQSLAALDEEFARLIDWANSAAVGGPIQIVLISDHGHITARENIDLSSALSSSGIGVSGNFENGNAFAGAAGYVGALHCAKPDQRAVTRFVAWLTDQPWCGLVFTAGGNGIEGGVAGTFDPELVFNDHARSPELFFLMRADDRPNAAGIDGSCFFAGEVPLGGSLHGGLHRREVKNLLALSGDLFRSRANLDAPAGIVDILPTVLTALDLPIPEGVDGRVLHEAFLNPAGKADGEVRFQHHVIEARHGSQHLRTARFGGSQYIVEGFLENTGR
ncbi:alkaline phosphatase family protein [Pelagibius sp.]|uniref:alkaline phosphatase family protein n=1 Tax=Pelagibius sp. TaxID=1931238 RepID=UPI003BB1DEFD